MKRVSSKSIPSGQKHWNRQEVLPQACILRTEIIFLNDEKFPILNSRIRWTISAFLDPADAVGDINQKLKSEVTWMAGGSKVRPQDRLVFTVDANPSNAVEGHGRNHQGHAVHLDNLFVPRAVHTPNVSYTWLTWSHVLVLNWCRSN